MKQFRPGVGKGRLKPGPKVGEESLRDDRRPRNGLPGVGIHTHLLRQYVVHRTSGLEEPHHPEPAGPASELRLLLGMEDGDARVLKGRVALLESERLCFVHGEWRGNSRSGKCQSGLRRRVRGVDAICSENALQ